jgi:F0F1-type ATP synthase assembly protein I
MGLDMSWRLALSILVPIIGGVELDNVLSSSPICLILGFILATVLATLIIRRSVRLANQHEVLNPPKTGAK